MSYVQEGWKVRVEDCFLELKVCLQCKDHMYCLGWEWWGLEDGFVLVVLL